MVNKLVSLRVLLAVILSAAMLGALACAADEPTAAAVVVPSPVPASEIAAMVRDAVSASVPAATDPAEIQRMVAAAVAGGPGVSKAELQAAISAQAGGQMTAADVKKVVDSAIMSMPAPKVDPTEIAGLVQRAVAASVPEGVSAAQIEDLVKGAVSAATSGVPTRGELEAAIRSSVSSATAGQLTAAQVSAIVDASVDAMAANVQAQLAEAAAMSQKIALIGAGGSSVTVPPLPAPFYRHDVALDDSQMLVWPVSRRSAVEPWKEGSVKGRYWMRYTYMPPFIMDEEDNLIASLAVGYDVNQDSTVVTLHLDPDAHFHDGTPLTAELVKMGWEFGSAPEQQASWGGVINFLRDVQGMPAVGKGDAAEASGLDAIDDHTLLIKLTKPAPDFVLNLARVSFGVVNIPALEMDAGWKNHPPGIGQFKVEWNPDTTEATATAVGPGQFWGAPATLAGVNMPVVTDQQTQSIMYENGEADVGPNFAIKDNPSHALFGDLTYNRSGGCCYYFAFAFNKAPFEDRNVRAALTHAFDMTAAVSAVFPGSGTAAGMINGDLPCVNPDKAPYAFDAEKAREHLAMSTYGSAANLPPITVSLGSANFIQIAELMQESWRDHLGVELTIVKRESGQSIPPEANMYRRSLGTTVPDYANVVWMLGHSESSAVDDLGFKTNPKQAEVDALIDAASVLPLSHPDRCAKYQEIENKVIDDYYRMYSLTVEGGHASNAVQPWVLGYSTQWYGDWYNVPYWKIGKRDRSLYTGHVWPGRKAE